MKWMFAKALKIDELDKLLIGKYKWWIIIILIDKPKVNTLKQSINQKPTNTDGTIRP